MGLDRKCTKKKEIHNSIISMNIKLNKVCNLDQLDNADGSD